MAQAIPITPHLAGDPVRLGPDVTSVAELLAALDLPGLTGAGYLALAPGAGLVHALDAPVATVAIRWVDLPHEPRLAPAAPPVKVVVVVTAPLAEAGRALRLIARLRAGLAEPEALARAAGARAREDLVRALARLDREAGEASLDGAEVLAALGTGPAGLADTEARRRLARVGPNRLERVRRRPLVLGLLEELASFFALLLWVAAALAFAVSLPELGWAILVVILVNGTFSFLQEYRAERAVERLQALLPRRIAVVRDGEDRPVPAEAVVPGDLVRLEEGDQVPADGQLLAAEGLRVDQSALTGEAHAVCKLPVVGDQRERVPRLERHELVFAGTSVAVGSGLAVVTATGMRTEIGGVAHLTQAVAEEPSPLQREMARVTRVVTLLAVSLGLGFFVVGVAAGILGPADAFLFALGIVVANVPEGLLPTLTLALALGVQRMARLGTIVKRLSAVEGLGATTVICTDKTGTLTEGRMAFRAAWASGRLHGVEAVRPDGPAEVRDLLAAAVLASRAMAGHGDPTEVALVEAAVAAGIEPDALRRAHALRAAYPFDSFRRRMTLVHAAAGGLVAYVKGAPRETLALCATVRWEGRTVPLTDAVRQAFLADHDRLAAEGLRLLAVACRPLPEALVGAPQGAVERDLTLLGLTALWDPPRPEVPEAVALCQRAGIRVVMVTGDYGETARAIARRIGLGVDKVVTGEEVERLGADALRRLLAEPGVLFARASPAHKLALVEGLKALGERVAVTGDGVNDAPALKAAATGVAMGRRGTEVAREAADVVIADDNFASVVAAIRQGRAVYANIGKFVTYIFASNVPELVPFLAFALFGIPLPLTLMQILAVDLGTDLIPALALGAEPPEPDVMDRPPRGPQTRLLGARRLLRAYGFLGVIEAALALGAYFWTYRLAGWRPGLPLAATGALYRRATTMTLGGIVAAQVGNLFACRTDRESVVRVGLGANPLVFLGIAAEVGVFLALIAVPPLRAVFGVAPLAFAEWGLLLLFPPVVLLCEEGRKAVVRWASPR